MNIKEIPSFKEHEVRIKQVEALLANKKVLRIQGFKEIQILKLESDLKKFKREFEKLQNLPDQFNELFSDSGWFCYESLNLELMEEAVNTANKEGRSAAEKLILTYYLDEKYIRSKILSIFKQKPFKIRRHIINEALDRHFNGHYYSSVTLFLTIIDGFVNDFKNTGFFASNTDLEAWDSIAAHSTGLSKISSMINRGRNKTSEERIEFPFRNGILHGRDLNFGNDLVSAKCLQIVLALFDWANALIKMNEGKSSERYIEPTYEEHLQNLADALRKHKEVRAESKLIDSWKRREIRVGVDIPEYGEAEAYTESTPEFSLIKLFEYINANNYGNIAKLLYQPSKPKSIGKLAGEYREKFKHIRIDSFKLIEIVDVAAAVSTIKVELKLLVGIKEITRMEEFRWLSVNEQAETKTRNSDNVCWKFYDNFSIQWETLSLTLR